MIRTRVDGTKFQEEVRKGLERLQVPNLPVRLHTNAIRSISDFIIFSRTVAILEVKETSSKSYSTRTMQQREKVEEFQKFYALAQSVFGHLPYRIYVLVHFISEEVYVVYDLTEGFEILRPWKEPGTSFKTLREALLYIVEKVEWK